MRTLTIVIFTFYSLGCATAKEPTAQKTSAQPAVEQQNVSAQNQKTPNTKPQESKKQPTDDISQIKAVLKKYAHTTGVKSTVQKEVKLELLGEEKKSEGQIYFYNGNVRIEISKPDESLVVLSPEIIWVVTPPDKDLGTKTQVTKIVSKKSQGQSRAPLALLLTEEKTWDEFKIVKSGAQKSDGVALKTVELKPRDAKKMKDISRIEFAFSEDAKQIQRISYWDDLENQTTFTFLKTNFQAEVDPRLFKYVPPKDAEITIFE